MVLSSFRRAIWVLLLVSSFSLSIVASVQETIWRDDFVSGRSNDATVWLSDKPLARRRVVAARRQQTRKTICNTVLASWTVEEVSTSFFNALGNTSYTAILEFALQFKFGVQFRTVCASCRDILPTLNSTVAASLNDICGPNVYGENATVSGLAIIPLTGDGSQLAPGTMKGVVYCHGTRTDRWPSTDYQGPNNTSIETLQFAALASLGGSVIILPDFMGYGASQGILYKAYTVLKSYQTSFIPLWYETQNLLAKESNCASVLANQAAVVGYSEGGYSSVAVAQALTKAGIHVLHVDSGGGPFRVLLSILSILKGVDDGTFDIYNRYIFALIGSAYSGTYPLPNSNDTSQYILSSTARSTLVSLVSESSSAEALDAQIPSHNPFSVFNSRFVAITQAAVSAGNFDPCANNSSIFQSQAGLVCKALQLDDLTNYLETQVNYPVRLCHSPQDNLVAYANLPNISMNSQFLSLIPGVNGTHEEAAFYCIVQAFLYLISADFQGVVVPNEAQSGGCVTPAPSSAFAATVPTQAPNSVPTTSTTSVSSSSCGRFSLAGVIGGVICLALMWI